MEEHKVYVEQMARIYFFVARRLKEKTPETPISELIRNHTPLFFHALNYMDYETQ